MTHHLEAWAQTPTAHPCSTTMYTTLIVSLLCLIVFPTTPLPGRHHFQAFAYDVRSAAFYFIDITCFSNTMHNEIIQYTYFICTILAMSILYFVNNVKICILHCHYDCLLLLCWKCRNKTKLKLKLKLIPYFVNQLINCNIANFLCTNKCINISGQIWILKFNINCI